MDGKLISVIVPVYNVEKYIRECLDSILAQTYRCFELIIVDDGSTDNSGKICDEYIEADERVKVFHKENGGLSSARNKGLDEANGEFICFIDSDDTIRMDYLEKLFGAISANDADMAFCDMDAQKLSDELFVGNKSAKMSSYSAKEWLLDDRSREYVLMVVACNKLYSKKIFDEIRFPLGRLHEDEFMIGPVLNRCEYVSFVCEKLYIYRENEVGITSTVNKMNIRHLDAIDALSERICQAIKDKDSLLAISTLKNALYKCARYYSEALISGAEEMKRCSRSKYKDIYREFSGLLSYKQRVKYSFFIFCPKVFNRIFNP